MRASPPSRRAWRYRLSANERASHAKVVGANERGCIAHWGLALALYALSARACHARLRRGVAIATAACFLTPRRASRLSQRSTQRATAHPPLTPRRSVHVRFVDKAGVEHAAKGLEGENLLHVAHAAGVDLEGACECSLACSTCHVILTPDAYAALSPPGEDEDDLLDLAFGLTPTCVEGGRALLGTRTRGAVGCWASACVSDTHARRRVDALPLSLFRTARGSAARCGLRAASHPSRGACSCRPPRAICTSIRAPPQARQETSRGRR